MIDEARRVATEIGGLLGVSVDADVVVGGRAALLELTRPSRISAGGATRLLPAADGFCAIALPRDDDIAALPALIEADTIPGDPWVELSRWAARRCADEIVERTGLLDIAAAALGEAAAAPPVIRPCAAAAVAPRTVDGLLVVDMSSLWAGPLCGALLGRAGAVVVKVESARRPDGTRRGRPAFFDWVNAGKLSYAVDFDADTEALRRLLRAADIVIEGSRPSALKRRGLGADDVTGRPGRVWLRVNGYRDNADRIAFGDDAAVAGGLVGAGPVFFGDAIADPLSGLEATRAIAESLRRGGGEVIDVSMAQVAARYPATGDVPTVERPATSPAAALGADNAAVERLVAERVRATC